MNTPELFLMPDLLRICSDSQHNVAGNIISMQACVVSIRLQPQEAPVMIVKKHSNCCFFCHVLWRHMPRLRLHGTCLLL